MFESTGGGGGAGLGVECFREGFGRLREADGE
jgi:hypothetical protein